MKRLDLLAKCPHCNRKHSNSKTAVIDQKGGRTTLFITCGNCNVSALILVSEGPMGLISLGMMIDLERDEVQKFIGRTAITVDEVIEVHKLLKVK